jgi:DNA-binding SARP family transcriptional activator/Tfp pilus assembly protein PilF
MVAEASEFCLLGPLVVRSGGMEVTVPPGKQRVLLAALLLNAGRVVPVAELSEALWGTAPPASARVTVQNYVKRLRSALGDADRTRISTHPAGYLIRVTGGELDVTRFEALLRTAREAAGAGSWADAAAQAAAALALWRGEPLADIRSDALTTQELPRLTELRLQALELRIDAELQLGRTAEVIAELRQLAAAEPLRERLHALLMLALYRDGRRGEALAAYEHARLVLMEELRTEPGSELTELHRKILVADPALAGTPEARRPPAAYPELLVPRQLPAPVAHFAGRAAELTALTQLLDRADRQTPPTVVISAIGGTAGVGKTALAVSWAHQVAGRFPDGQLYVNLRGYDPGQPVPPGDALAGFLRAQGMAGQDIPVELEERAARYRSLLSGRRLLVILDNAGSVQQVRPLLPGAPGCMVLVTSRDSLAGLVARDGARRLELDLLPQAEAVGLLRELIGDRADADPAAAAALARQCCRLPLALRVAAELAAARPRMTLAALAAELADQQRRLDLLEAGGDARTAVRAVFSWSCRNLDTAAFRAFRLAGLHPGPDLEPYAVAAITDTSIGQARHLLDQLVRAHLIQPAGEDRYGLHDLLRAYARELADARDSAADRRAALTRLFDYYLHTAAAGMNALHGAERDRRPLVASATPVPELTEPDIARAWLDAERASLVAVARYAGQGWPGHVIRLADLLSNYLDASGHHPQAITIHSCAQNAARQAGDRAAEATALRNLGFVYLRQDGYQEAASHFLQALALFRETGDRYGQASVLANLGVLEGQQRHGQRAVSYLRQALAVQRELGNRAAEASALGNLGCAYELQGRYRQAAECLQQSHALYLEASDLTGQAYALGNLGDVYLRQDRCQQAADHLQQALALSRQAGDRVGQANMLNNLGTVHLRLGRYQQADDHHQQALDLCRETGSRSGEAEALNGLGEVLLATGRTGPALAQHTGALRLASEIGDKYQQARAHDGLARSYRASGDTGRAREHWQRALALHTDLGLPEAEQVRAQLIAVG